MIARARIPCSKLVQVIVLFISASIKGYTAGIAISRCFKKLAGEIQYFENKAANSIAKCKCSPFLSTNTVFSYPIHCLQNRRRKNFA